MVSSEKSRYLFKKINPTASFHREETVAVLEAMSSSALAERLWQRSEADISLSHQLAVVVLQSRFGSLTEPNAHVIGAFLEDLRGLCVFEAEWRESEDGWALFFAEIVSAVKFVSIRVPIDMIRSQIQEIIETLEESSSQMDDCYSCSLEIEQLKLLFTGEE